VNTGTLAGITRKSLMNMQILDCSKENFHLNEAKYKKIMKRLQVISVYIFKEILIKFIFCYLLAVFGFIAAISIDNGNVLKGLLINIAFSLISLPLVFVFYDRICCRMHSVTCFSRK
jgi:uncharacterized membrane protein YagU involved in acid resistance